MNVFNSDEIDTIEEACQRVINKYYNCPHLKEEMQIILNQARELERRYQIIRENEHDEIDE